MTNSELDPAGRDVELLRAAVEHRIVWNDHHECWDLWPRLAGRIEVSEIVPLEADALDHLVHVGVIILRSDHRIWVSDHSKRTLAQWEEMTCA